MTKTIIIFLAITVAIQHFFILRMSNDNNVLYNFIMEMMGTSTI